MSRYISGKRGGLFFLKNMVDLLPVVIIIYMMHIFSSFGYFYKGGLI